MDPIIILGSGGHALSVADVIEREGKYKIAGFIAGPKGASAGTSYPILGQDDDLEDIYYQGITHAAIGIGYLGKGDLRNRLFTILKKIGYTLPVICDPSAIVSSSAVIEEGTFIGKGAIINTGSTIGRMAIINTGSIVEHECKIGEFSHISIGTVLCGNVTIGASSFVGANATVIQGIRLPDHTFIPAASLIKQSPV